MIIGILLVVIILIIGAWIWTVNTFNKQSGTNEEVFKTYYYMVNQWLKKRNSGKQIKDFFDNEQIKTIAIYGTGEIGMRLYEELKNSDIKISYMIDRNAVDSYKYDEVPVYNLDETKSQELVDAIVVTPVYDFENIEKTLINLGVQVKVFSLEEIVYEL